MTKPPEQTGPMLDLTLQHKTLTFGPITAVFTWSLHNHRPVLVLIPTFRRSTVNRVQPCAVPIDDAWRFDEQIGDPRRVADTTAAFTVALGGAPGDSRMAMRIYDIIQNCLYDLLTMPPRPIRDTSEIVAEAVATDIETGKTIEAEIQGNG